MKQVKDELFKQSPGAEADQRDSDVKIKIKTANSKLIWPVLGCVDADFAIKYSSENP